MNFLSLAGVTMKYRDRLRTSPSAPLGDMTADLTVIMFLNAVVTMGMFLFSLMEEKSSHSTTYAIKVNYRISGFTKDI